MAETRLFHGKPEFKYLHSFFNISADLKLAIYYGDLNTIKNIIEAKGYPIASIKSKIICELAHRGHLKILQYFIDNHYVMPSITLLHIAAIAGHLPIVKWLREEKKFPLTLPDYDEDYHKNYLIWILRKGHLSIANWLIAHEKFSLSQANSQVNLVLDACHYQQWHVLQWLVITHKFPLTIDLWNSKIRYSLGQYIEHDTNAESWPFIYKIVKRIFSTIRDKEEWDYWYKLLNEKYDLARFSIHLSKDEITYQYRKVHYRARRFFFQDLPDEMLKLVCRFLTPHEVFYSVRFVNKRYNQVINHPTFIAELYQRYFGENLYQINPENYYKHFVKNYHTRFKSMDTQKALAIHCCLAEDVPDSINFTFHLFNLFYPKIEEKEYFYSFLLKINRIACIHHYASTLLSLPNPALRYHNHYPIVMLARFNLTNEVKCLLEKDKTIINQYSGGQFALMWAVIHGYTDMVKLLLENNADLRIKDALHVPHYTPLDYAFINRHLEIIPILLEAYANITDFQHEIKNPFIWAAEHGDLDILQVLYLYNKKLGVKEEDKRTSLHRAAVNGHDHIVKFLLQQSPTLLSSSTEIETLFNLAYKHKQTAVSHVLVPYIYKLCQTLPCYILSKMKLLLSPSYPICSFFGGNPNLNQLYKHLIHIVSENKNSIINTIKLMLAEIISEIKSQKKIDTALVLLLEDSLTWIFGHHKFLETDKSLVLNIPNDYWQLLHNEEDKITEELQQYGIKTRHTPVHS